MCGMADSKPTTIDEYIAAAAPAARPVLLELAAILGAAAPDAVEAIKWRTPVWETRRILYSISAYRAHAAFMPTASTLDRFRAEVEAAGLTTTAHMVQLRYDAPVPSELIRRIADHRVWDVAEHDAHWAGSG